MDSEILLDARPVAPRNIVVNDIHSSLNATTVSHLLRPRSLMELAAIIKTAIDEKTSLSIAGGRHAMGGQQFLDDGLLLDMTALRRVLHFDQKHGRITVESGLCWPDLLRELARLQKDHFHWTIRQKQTGADRLSIGGALSANIHGRGLQFKPLVQDICAFEIFTADGLLIHCSRNHNPDLFALAIGGYGLFGVIYSVTLQLVPRQKLERVVTNTNIDELIPAFENRIASGFLYGDFQFAIDPLSGDFLNRGILSCYKPVSRDAVMPNAQKQLSPAHWERLLYLAHADKTRAYQEYAAHYQSTNGQLYWSDDHQFSHYPEGYHAIVDQKLNSACSSSEVITEIYVPRNSLAQCLAEVRAAARKDCWNIIYGTIRLIERDQETFLAWAREPWICIIFNLCVEHSPAGLKKARYAFQSLIQIAIQCSGSYYLTYHRWVAPDQLHKCHPAAPDFFAQKLKHDPNEIFTSNWYNHYKVVFS